MVGPGRVAKRRRDIVGPPTPKRIGLVLFLIAYAALRARALRRLADAAITLPLPQPYTTGRTSRRERRERRGRRSATLGAPCGAGLSIRQR